MSEKRRVTTFAEHYGAGDGAYTRFGWRVWQNGKMIHEESGTGHWYRHQAQWEGDSYIEKMKKAK